MNETTTTITTTTTGPATDHDTDRDADRAAESGTDANYRPTIGDVDHTDPHTDTPFGTAIAYRRGPTIVADGGEREEVGEDPEEEPGVDGDASANGRERMGDVEHAPPNDETVNRVHERGGEGREDK